MMLIGLNEQGTSLHSFCCLLLNSKLITTHFYEAKMIEFKNIEKYYQNKFVKTYVLRNINLKIEEGEFVSIMGPSGAGKSTLLYIMGMLDTASNGEYFFLDEPVHKMNERKLSNLHKSYIGFVFQQYHLIDELTVYENLETPLLYQKVKGSERKGLVADILDRFNIVGKKDLFPKSIIRWAAAISCSCTSCYIKTKTYSGR